MTRFERSVAAFDAQNADDPQVLHVDGAERPRELVQAERLSRWVLRLSPEASEALRLAARCQHLRRWEIPRASYPEGRIGYLEWRKALGRFHADRAAAILRREGYDDVTIERVRTINQKKGITADPEVQTMEDALCLAFLEHEAEDFAARHDEAKVIDILRKTWRKMSPAGHEAALGLSLSAPVKRLVGLALGST